LLDRTPRSYIFLLAGYTAGIIGFSTVNAPETIFDTALARVEEITLGILCATLVHTIFFPRSVLGALNLRIAGFLRDAEAWATENWAADILTGQRRIRVDRERQRLAADLTELHILSTHLPFDTATCCRLRRVSPRCRTGCRCCCRWPARSRTGGAHCRPAAACRTISSN
jgi:uncharacterized membrane protein YccC